jgi:hypothetical protein
VKSPSITFLPHARYGGFESDEAVAAVGPDLVRIEDRCVRILDDDRFSDVDVGSGDDVAAVAATTRHRRLGAGVDFMKPSRPKFIY